MSQVYTVVGITEAGSNAGEDPDRLLCGGPSDTAMARSPDPREIKEKGGM